MNARALDRMNAWTTRNVPGLLRYRLRMTLWQEDKQLQAAIQELEYDWQAVARRLEAHGYSGKSVKQCRERYRHSSTFRWNNYVNPQLAKAEFTQTEAETIFRAHKKFGNKWVDIAQELPGRLVSYRF